MNLSDPTFRPVLFLTTPDSDLIHPALRRLESLHSIDPTAVPGLDAFLVLEFRLIRTEDGALDMLMTSLARCRGVASQQLAPWLLLTAAWRRLRPSQNSTPPIVAYVHAAARAQRWQVVLAHRILQNVRAEMGGMARGSQTVL